MKKSTIEKLYKKTGEDREKALDTLALLQKEITFSIMALVGHETEKALTHLDKAAGIMNQAKASVHKCDNFCEFLAVATDKPSEKSEQLGCVIIQLTN